jgi:diaminopimelate decarboxylase
MSFLSAEQIQRIRTEYGTPVYVYDEATLLEQARKALAFPSPSGLTVRYAMKALPTGAIVRLLNRAGLHIDASSGFEAERAIAAGVPPEQIQITAQELPKDLKGLVDRGVLFNACSPLQLETYGRLFPGTEVSVRINPGLGSGHNNRTNVGGPSSSFGIWHEKLPEIVEIAAEYQLKITGMHTHIGSGGDPEVWKHCATLSLAIAERLPDVTRLSLGGGFKVARLESETSADLQEIGEAVGPMLEDFEQRRGHPLHLEIEPGTFLVANAGVILANVIDVVDTGEGGHHFVKVDSGMTELLRPNLYGAQHPIEIVPADGDEEREMRETLVAGHCCESGDMLTPAPGNPEGLGPRLLPAARPGDTLVIGGAGAYCSGLQGKNYNSFPEAAEVLLTTDGDLRLIRKRQSLEQVVQNEILE